MENEKKSQVNITNNFNAPIGQHIDHVDNIFFSMERDGTFHFAHVDNIHTDEHPAASPAADNHGDEELCHFVHPSFSGDEAWQIHNEVKNLVRRQAIQEICRHLTAMAKEKKILLPQNPSSAYSELVRLGMPTGTGFNIKTFQKYYR